MKYIIIAISLAMSATPTIANEYKPLPGFSGNNKPIPVPVFRPVRECETKEEKCS